METLHNRAGTVSLASQQTLLAMAAGRALVPLVVGGGHFYDLDFFPGLNSIQVTSQSN